MTTLLDRLGPKERKGSKPRCHWMTHGDREAVARRLTDLIEPWGRVSATDRWMPEGFENVEEAQLHCAPNLLEAPIGKELLDWWLAVHTGVIRTPNWDIASTCTVTVDGGNKSGLLLVEAKAHHAELGDKTDATSAGSTASHSDASKANRASIEAATRLAREGLEQTTSLPWAIAHDSNYQISNRFAWSWKLTELGYPVILVYLGFLNAHEMPTQLADHDEWASLVKSHGEPHVPADVWDRSWTLPGQSFIPLIRTDERPYDRQA